MARNLITVSHFSRSELVRYCGYDVAKITVPFHADFQKGGVSLQRTRLYLYYRFFFMEPVKMFFKSLILAAGVFFISVPSIAPAFDVGLNPAPGAGMQDTHKAFTAELGAHSVRTEYPFQNNAIEWASQNGKSVVFMLGYGRGCNPTTVSGRQCYADRSANLAQEHGSKVEYYEVWNEWNGGIGLGCNWKEPPCNDAAMYTDLLCKTYKAIKDVRRNAQVAGGVVAGANEKFITGMLDAGAGDCMDVLSLHLSVYRQSWPGHVAADAPGSVGADKFIQVIKDRQDLVRAMTGRTIPIPIIVSEAAFHGKNEQLGAEYVAELYRQAAAVPFLEGIWWFQLKDNPNRGTTFGLLRSNNTKKSAFEAYQAVASEH